MIEVVIYETENGACPYINYVSSMKDKQAQSKILETVTRIECGQMPKTEPLRKGLQEIKIHLGEGHRVYFYLDGQTVVVLLSASNKRNQSKEIEAALGYLADYKRQKAKIRKV